MSNTFNNNHSTTPNVLVLSGLDPSGGAGLQADIQTLTALGCHPLPLITCLTVQNTCNVQSLQSVDAELLTQQIEYLIQDIQISAVKIGLISSLSVLEILVDLVQNLDCPVVLDPVLKAGGGKNLTTKALQIQLCDQLLPHISIVTPNSIEARQLTGCDDLEQAATILLDKGCAVLLTGGHEHGTQLCNTLYQKNQPKQDFMWTRQTGEYHGTGCTLASALTAGLAQGIILTKACQQALDYTNQSVKLAFKAGKGQWIPRRIGY
jgi:hydroxymethylpyrimidine/phosphomethylpyrimidine kinase